MVVCHDTDQTQFEEICGTEHVTKKWRMQARGRAEGMSKSLAFQATSEALTTAKTATLVRPEDKTLQSAIHDV
jgi:hypothetical protein